MTEAVKIKAEIMWAYLTKPNEMSGKYQVDLVNLNKEQVEAIEKTGVLVKQKDDKGFYVTCKSSNYEITPYDKNGEVIGSGVKVGNGSRADLVVKPYSWKSPTGQSGMSLGISKLIVKDLNVYNPDAVVEEDDTL